MTTNTKISKNIASIRFVISLSYKVEFDVLKWQFRVAIFNLNRLLIDNWHYKNILLTWTGFNLVIRNSKYILLRSTMAFKKFGKEPFNKRTTFLSFTLNILNSDNYTMLATNWTYAHINKYFEEFFYAFGGEITSIRYGYVEGIEFDDNVHFMAEDKFGCVIGATNNYTVLNTIPENSGEVFKASYADIVTQPIFKNKISAEFELHNFIFNGFEFHNLSQVYEHTPRIIKQLIKRVPTRFFYYNCMSSIYEFKNLFGLSKDLYSNDIKNSYIGNSINYINLIKYAIKDIIVTIPNCLNTIAINNIKTTINNNLYYNNDYTNLDIYEINSNYLYSDNISTAYVAEYSIFDHINNNITYLNKLCDLTSYEFKDSDFDMSNCNFLYLYEWILSNPFNYDANNLLNEIIDENIGWYKFNNMISLEKLIASFNNITSKINISHINYDNSSLQKLFDEYILYINTIEDTRGDMNISMLNSCSNIIYNNILCEYANNYFYFNNIHNGVWSICNRFSKNYIYNNKYINTKIYVYNYVYWYDNNYNIIYNNTVYFPIKFLNLNTLCNIKNNYNIVKYLVDYNYIFFKINAFKQIYDYVKNIRRLILNSMHGLFFDWLKVDFTTSYFYAMYNHFGYFTEYSRWTSSIDLDYTIGVHTQVALPQFLKNDAVLTLRQKTTDIQSDADFTKLPSNIYGGNIVEYQINDIYLYNYTIYVTNDITVSITAGMDNYIYSDDSDLEYLEYSNYNDKLFYLEIFDYNIVDLSSFDIKKGYEKKNFFKNKKRISQRTLDTIKFRSSKTLFNKLIDEADIADNIYQDNIVNADTVIDNSFTYSVLEKHIINSTQTDDNMYNTSITQINNNLNVNQNFYISSTSSNSKNSELCIIEQYIIKSTTLLSIINKEINNITITGYIIKSIDGYNIFKDTNFYNISEKTLMFSNIERDISNIKTAWKLDDIIDVAAKFEYLRRYYQGSKDLNYSNIIYDIKTSIKNYENNINTGLFNNSSDIICNNNIKFNKNYSNIDTLDRLENLNKNYISTIGFGDYINFTKPWYSYVGSFDLTSYEFIMQLRSLTATNSFTKYSWMHNIQFDEIVDKFSDDMFTAWAATRFDSKFVLAICHGDIILKKQQDIAEMYSNNALKYVDRLHKFKTRFELFFKNCESKNKNDLLLIEKARSLNSKIEESIIIPYEKLSIQDLNIKQDLYINLVNDTNILNIGRTNKSLVNDAVVIAYEIYGDNISNDNIIEVFSYLDEITDSGIDIIPRFYTIHPFDKVSANKRSKCLVGWSKYKWDQLNPFAACTVFSYNDITNYNQIFKNIHDMHLYIITGSTQYDINNAINTLIYNNNLIANSIFDDFKFFAKNGLIYYYDTIQSTNIEFELTMFEKINTSTLVTNTEILDIVSYNQNIKFVDTLPDNLLLDNLLLIETLGYDSMSSIKFLPKDNINIFEHTSEIFNILFKYRFGYMFGGKYSINTGYMNNFGTKVIEDFNKCSCEYNICVDFYGHTAKNILLTDGIVKFVLNNKIYTIEFDGYIYRYSCNDNYYDQDSIFNIGSIIIDENGYVNIYTENSLSTESNNIYSGSCNILNITYTYTIRSYTNISIIQYLIVGYKQTIKNNSKIFNVCTILPFIESCFSYKERCSLFTIAHDDDIDNGSIELFDSWSSVYNNLTSDIIDYFSVNNNYNNLYTSNGFLNIDIINDYSLDISITSVYLQILNLIFYDKFIHTMLNSILTEIKIIGTYSIDNMYFNLFELVICGISSIWEYAYDICDNTIYQCIEYIIDYMFDKLPEYLSEFIIDNFIIFDKNITNLQNKLYNNNMFIFNIGLIENYSTLFNNIFNDNINYVDCILINNFTNRHTYCIKYQSLDNYTSIDVNTEFSITNFDNIIKYTIVHRYLNIIENRCLLGEYMGVDLTGDIVLSNENYSFYNNPILYMYTNILSIKDIKCVEDCYTINYEKYILLYLCTQNNFSIKIDRLFLITISAYNTIINNCANNDIIDFSNKYLNTIIKQNNITTINTNESSIYNDYFNFIQDKYTNLYDIFDSSDFENSI